MESEASEFNLLLHRLRKTDEEFDMFLRANWDRKQRVSDILRNSPMWQKFVKNGTKSLKMVENG